LVWFRRHGIVNPVNTGTTAPDTTYSLRSLKDTPQQDILHIEGHTEKGNWRVRRYGFDIFAEY
jgi:hypothetical protein